MLNRTAFQLARALGAPFLAVYGSRIAPKHQLVGGLGLFAIGNVLAALTPTDGLMIAVRVLMALSAAAFVPEASAVGSALAPPESRGKALAVVWGGFTVATGHRRAPRDLHHRRCCVVALDLCFHRGPGRARRGRHRSIRSGHPEVIDRQGERLPASSPEPRRGGSGGRVRSDD